ncbi:hypothetical protein VOLCADRAFT_117862 [Volvox carteri f. nagariensis]|uniref:C2 domain-containing protein n=1 Tax=Volvox carteri f. nagariensis TaxID=3068 RepID=D8TYT0_VOLCA|nr:uncharacterized protein VOLCADRAFT_117862 [Volvox carteri f. nagariensis]EFJ47447.1 hypothetical protein VOLCADRAFT_117862 [Volvox carteri f. nagariensis]|eukprot:XP_002951636.1 hypothetical protein VOLCADRAFT_117862 [Volvox carteri f. nagariensis]
MGSPGPEDRTYILSINIQDGKAFGPDLQAVACAATFAGETKLTPYSVGRDTHIWNTTLQWRVTMDQFRRFTALGQKDCKVVLSNKDGTKLGWFLVDIRAAKLQAQYKKTEGTWVSLTGAKKGEIPQVCMVALFYEDRPDVSFSLEPKPSPSKSRAGAAGSPPARNPTAGLPNFGSPGPNPENDGPFRKFALTVDVRSFQSSKRLPLSSANVYLVVSSGYRLPSRLAPLCSHPAVDIPRGAEGSIPNGYGTLEFSAGVVQLARVLASEPRISVEAWHKERFRTDMLLGAGSVPLSPLLQGAWVDGYAPLFALVASSVGGEVREERVQMGLMRVVLSLEDKGAAVPGPRLAPGPQAQLIPPAQAIMDATAADVPPPPLAAAAVEVLRPRPNPYDPGEIAAFPSNSGATATATTALPGGLLEGGNELNIREMHPAPTAAEKGSASQADAVGPQQQQQQRQPPAGLLPQQQYSRAPPPAVSLGSPQALTRAGAAAGGARADVAGGPESRPLHGAVPEFEAAWELEVWKKAEEARWRAELRERESQRMLVLESEWRRRERAREAELASLKAEYLAMEDKAQQALAAAEARERRILAAEEALLRRRKELEREHAARMVEAEAAVRRLQVECEHQLDIERDRNTELVRRVAALEERLAASEMRCLTVENEFADFRAASRSTPEAELARQLAEAREAVKAAEGRAAKAAKAKQGYKEQVRKLAEQVAALQRRRHHRGSDSGEGALALAVPGSVSGAALPVGPDTSAIRAAAEEHARYAASQQQELAAMRAQLQAIKTAALAQLSPSSSPRGGHTDAAAAAAAGAAAVPSAAARAAMDAADEAAPDLRSSDQQRTGRTEWRAAVYGGGRKASALQSVTAARDAAQWGDQRGLRSAGPPPSPPTDRNDAPLSRPPLAQLPTSSSSGTTTPANNSTSSSNSTTAVKHMQQPRGGNGGDEAAAPYTHLDGATAARAGGSGGGSGPVRQRWAEPRAAASAPPAAGDGSGDLSPLVSAPGLDQASSGKAASAPAPVLRAVSTATSMTRTATVEAVVAVQPPPQRRGWSRLYHQSAPTQWEDGAAMQGRREGDLDGAGGDEAGGGGEDSDSRWGDDDREPLPPPYQQQQQQPQQQLQPHQRQHRRQQPEQLSDATAAANLAGGNDDGEVAGDDGDVHARRSLADHLANASSAATRLRQLQLQRNLQDVNISSGTRSRGVSPSRPAGGDPHSGGARAGWQLPQQHSQQQEHHKHPAQAWAEAAQHDEHDDVYGIGPREDAGVDIRGPGDPGGMSISFTADVGLGLDADLEEVSTSNSCDHWHVAKAHLKSERADRQDPAVLPQHGPHTEARTGTLSPKAISSVFFSFGA